MNNDIEKIFIQLGEILKIDYSPYSKDAPLKRKLIISKLNSLEYENNLLRNKINTIDKIN